MTSKIIPLTLAVTFIVGTAYADQLSDADWMSYFGKEGAEFREFKISTISPFGHLEFIQRVKPKGTISIAGKDYRESAVLHDSGPFADRIIKTFIRIADDGLYERREDGTETFLVPRPLITGQTWANGKEILKFEGIEDLETFNSIVPGCLKIAVLSPESDTDGKGKEGTGLKYYEREKGLIYKSGNGASQVTKSLSEYASSKREH